MAILEILTYPDPRLAKKSTAVEKFDSALKKICTDMLETMYAAPGIGLAAPQVNIHKNIVVLDIDYEKSEEDPAVLLHKNPQIFINPKIVKKEGKTTYKEGCLSVPGEYENVDRFAKVSLEYQDLDGKKHSVEADDLLAIALQHELDHLDGRLFIDRLSFVKSRTIKKKILKEKKE